MIEEKYYKSGLIRDKWRDLWKGIHFDTFSYNIVKRFCRIGLVKYGEWVRDNLVNGGNFKDIIGFNILIDGYWKSGDMNYIVEVMDRMRKEGLVLDIISYNTLINGNLVARVSFL